MKGRVERDRVVRLFVGKGDFSEQLPLAHKRELQGWVVSKALREQKVLDAMDQVKGAIVVINGATAGDCVASITTRTLFRGAKRVIVPLNHVMGSYGQGEDTMLKRGRSLARQLNHAGLLDDVRLTITPSSAWKQAKKDVRDFFE